MRQHQGRKRGIASLRSLLPTVERLQRRHRKWLGGDSLGAATLNVPQRWIDAQFVVPVVLAALLVLAPVAVLPASAEGRIALVIGNSRYAAFGELTNPRNDAADVGAAFGRLGFDVTTVLDGTRVQMHEALQTLARRSLGADVAVVFYAGHGMEMDGVNYLIPVDARLERDTDVEYETVHLDPVLRATEGAALRLVILDACRNNPLAQRMRRSRATRSISRGSFGDLDEQQLLDETLVAYAAAAGTTAADGTARNSPYTAALLAYLEEPLEISALFRRVRRRVLETTDGLQRPHEYQSLLGDHYLSRVRSDSVTAVAEALPQGAVNVGAAPSRPSLRQSQSIDRLLRRANFPVVSVRMSASRSGDLSPDVNSRLEGEVRALLRDRGLEVVEPTSLGLESVVRIEGAVELSDAGDVAGTGLMSSTAAVSLQAIEEASGTVMVASRARSRGAGISQDAAGDKAGIRAVEDALDGFVDDLIGEWSRRVNSQDVVLLSVRGIESFAQITSLMIAIEDGFLETEDMVQRRVDVDQGTALLEWRGRSNASGLARWLSGRQFAEDRVTVVGTSGNVIQIEM